MVERILFELVISATSDSVAGDALGEKVRCPKCGTDDINGRFGPASFVPYLAGLLLAGLGGFFLTLGVGYYVFETEADDRNAGLLVAVASAASIALGTALMRFAWSRAYRSRFFRLSCRSPNCKNRWREGRRPGGVAFHAPVNSARWLAFLIVMSMWPLGLLLDW